MRIVFGQFWKRHTNEPSSIGLTLCLYKRAKMCALLLHLSLKCIHLHNQLSLLILHQCVLLLLLIDLKSVLLMVFSVSLLHCSQFTFQHGHFDLIFMRSLFNCAQLGLRLTQLGFLFSKLIYCFFQLGLVLTPFDCFCGRINYSKNFLYLRGTLPLYALH